MNVTAVPALPVPPITCDRASVCVADLEQLTEERCG
jgi:hypothetical protein